MNISSFIPDFMSSRIDDYARGLLYDQLQLEFVENNNLRTAFENVANRYERTGTSASIRKAEMCYELAEATTVQTGHKGDFASTALKYLPETEVSLIVAGQEYGLAQLMGQLSIQCDLMVRFHRGFKSNVYSPLFLIALILGMFVGAAFMIPYFGVDRAEWPTTTLIVHWIGSFVTNNNLTVLGAGTFLFLWSKYARRHYTGRFRPTLDKYPPFSLYRMEVGAQFLFFYLLLIKSNRQFNRRWASLYTQHDVPYVKDRIEKILQIMSDRHITPAKAMQEARTGFPEPEFLSLLEGLEANKVTVDEKGVHPLERRIIRWIDRLDDRIKDALAITNFSLYGVILLSLILIVVGVGQIILISNEGSFL